MASRAPELAVLGLVPGGFASYGLSLMTSRALPEVEQRGSYSPLRARRAVPPRLGMLPGGWRPTAYDRLVFWRAGDGR